MNSHPLPPQKAAESLLSEIWGDRGLPIDPVWIARKLGLDVMEVDLTGDVSGALFKESGKDPVIVLNAADSKQRQRFSCAHELGHYASRVERGDDAYEFVDFRSTTSSQGSDPEEIYANQYAANLLMPSDAVRLLHEHQMPAAVMAAKFGVSIDAMTYRLMNLRLR